MELGRKELSRQHNHIPSRPTDEGTITRPSARMPQVAVFCGGHTVTRPCEWCFSVHCTPVAPMNIYCITMQRLSIATVRRTHCNIGVLSVPHDHRTPSLALPWCQTGVYKCVVAPPPSPIHSLLLTPPDDASALCKPTSLRETHQCDLHSQVIISSRGAHTAYSTLR